MTLPISQTIINPVVSSSSFIPLLALSIVAAIWIALTIFIIWKWYNLNENTILKNKIEE